MINDEITPQSLQEEPVVEISDIKPQNSIRLPQVRVVPKTEILRSITRLVVGGVFLGYDVLTHRLQEWEQSVAETSGKKLPAPQNNGVPSQSADADAEIVTITPSDETDADLLRLAFIGMIFDTEKRIEAGIQSLDKASQAAGRMADPLFRPIHHSRLFGPFRRRYEQWIQRGEEEVSRWIEAGRTEEEHSKALANTALAKGVDDVIDYFAANQEIQELIQSQGVGLAGEVVEEVRERTVSADNLLEGMVRTMLRRPQRSELPEPPPVVKQQAEPFIQIKGRIVRK